MQRCGLDHVFVFKPGLANVELRNGRRGACPSELKTALIEPEVARDRAATGIRPDLQRTGDLRSDIVAIEKLSALCVEAQVQQRLAAGECDGPCPGDGASARSLPGDLTENELRTGEASLAREMVDDHAG